MSRKKEKRAGEKNQGGAGRREDGHAPPERRKATESPERNETEPAIKQEKEAPEKDSTSGKSAAFLAGLMALGAGLTYAAASVAPPLATESVHGLLASRPLPEIFRHHPPTFLISLLFERLLPHPWHAVMLAAAGVWGAYALARRYAPEHPALMAAAATAVFFPAIASGAWDGPERALMTATLLSAAALAAALEKNTVGRWAAVLAAFLFGMASGVSFAVPILAFTLCCWITRPKRGPSGINQNIALARLIACAALALCFGTAVYYPQRFFLASDVRFALDRVPSGFLSPGNPSQLAFVLAGLGGAALAGMNERRARWLGAVAPLVLIAEPFLMKFAAAPDCFNALAPALALLGVAALAAKNPKLKKSGAGLGALLAAPALALVLTGAQWSGLSRLHEAETGKSDAIGKGNLFPIFEAARNGKKKPMELTAFEALEAAWPLPGGWLARHVEIEKPAEVFRQDDIDRLIESGQMKEAENRVRRALEREPYRTRRLVQYARILLLNGNPDKAANWADRALAMAPGRPDAVLAKHDILIAKGESSAAARLLDGAGKAAGLTRVAEGWAEAVEPGQCDDPAAYGGRRLYALARATRELGRDAEARKCLDAAGPAWQALDRAEALAADGDYSGALTALDGAGGDGEPPFALQLKKAEYLYRSGSVKEAEAAYLKIRGMAPQLLESNRILVKMYIEATDLYQALNIDQAIVENNRNDVEARVALADIYRIMNSTKEAEREYKRALEMDPDNGGALEGLQRLSMGGAGRSAPRSPGAQPREGGPEPVSPRSPGADVRDLKERAREALQTRDWGKVTELMSEAAKRNPGDLEARAILARSLKETGRIDEARREIESIVSQPNVPASLIALQADILLAAGDREGARAAAERALKADPNDPDALRALSELENPEP